MYLNISSSCQYFFHINIFINSYIESLYSNNQVLNIKKYKKLYLKIFKQINNFFNIILFGFV